MKYLFCIIIFLASCNMAEEKEMNNKKLYQIEFDKRLEKMLFSDIRNRKNEIKSDFVYVLIVEKKEGVEHFRFYESDEGVKTEFRYFGYAYCDDVLILLRDIENYSDASLYYKINKNKFTFFNSTPVDSISYLGNDDPPPPIEHPFYFHYILENNSFSKGE